MSGICRIWVGFVNIVWRFLLQYNDYENDRDSYDYGQSVEKIVKGRSDSYDQKRSADAYHAGIGFIIAEAGSCEVSSTDSGKHLWKSKAGTYFNFDGRTFTVEFKIGINKMYVLKDAFSFDVHIANQDDYKYGKNLQFVHTIESFVEESRRLRNLSVNGQTTTGNFTDPLPIMDTIWELWKR